MTKTTGLSCLTAALLCLSIGNAIAEDNIETQQAKPDMTNHDKPDVTTNQQETQTKPKPKEEAGSNNPSKSNATQAEPECN